MIVTLIFGAFAGWAVRPAEPHLATLLARVLGDELMQDPAQRRVAVCFATLLAVAAVASVLGYPGRIFLFILAASVGYFQQEIREAYLTRRD